MGRASGRPTSCAGPSASRGTRRDFDLIIGLWGDGTGPQDRVLVSLSYHPRPGGGFFMVVSGKGRPADNRNLCDRALEREQVIGTPLAQEAFALVDALWLTEPRIADIRALDDLAHPA